MSKRLFLGLMLFSVIGTIILYMFGIDKVYKRDQTTVAHVFGGCSDNDSECPHWAKDGWCSRAKQFMDANCTLTCGKCKAIAGKGTVNGYVVYTPTCRILDIDPFHSSIKQFVHKEDAPLRCMGYHKLMSLKNGVLSPTEELMKMAPNVKCYYTTIERKFIEPDDNNWRYGNPTEFVLKSGTTANVSDDFIHIRCSKGNDQTVYDDFLTQTHIQSFKSKKDAMNLLPIPPVNNQNKRHRIDEKLNILMVGIDSMSRLNGRRQLTKLREYILKGLGGIELRGYNRVGDNTFLNICPLTTGTTIDEVKWDASKFLDDTPFVWKRYMANGYASLYAEDATSGSIFNYLKKGFSKYPTHHYYRGMSLALEKSAIYKKSPKWCCGRKGLHRWTLDYLHQFAVTYHEEKIPFFGFVFNTYISHDDINAVGKTDGEYTEFLQKLNDEAILNNTVVIVFGDHGYRFGGIRGTYVGRYAENLPMMLMAFPKWFAGKYPEYVNALRYNQNMLTTPFDIQETLRDLCTDCVFDVKNEHGLSLFDNIPTTRTCAKAGIPIHYCACREEKKISVDDANIVKASTALVGRINTLNSKKKELCLEQTLTKVLEASTTVHDQTFSRGCTLKNACYDSNWHKMQTSFIFYLVTIQTHPGHGQFQATIRQEDGKFSVMGDISRINLYGNTSSCITDDFNLRKFCYCKSNLA